MTQIEKTYYKNRNNLFSEAASNWDLIGIYQAIETVTPQPLSVLEKTIIRGLLCGYSSQQIAAICDLEPEPLIINLVRQLYSYVETIGNFPQESIHDYQNISLKLGILGYKKTDNTILLNTIDAKVEEIVKGGKSISASHLQDTKLKRIEPPHNNILPQTESRSITVADPPGTIVPTQPNSLPVVEANDFLPTIDRWTRLGSLFLLGSVGIAIALAAVTPYQVTVQTQAKIRPAGELRLVEAETEGTVTDIRVKENQVVNKGDILAIIDNSRLDTQKSQLESNIQQASLQLQQIQAQITAHNHRIQAESDRSNRIVASAKVELNRRQREYQDKQITTTTEVEEAEANLQAAKAALNAAKSKLNRYQTAATQGAISKNQLEEVRVAVNEHEQAVKANQAKLKRAQTALNPLDAEVAIARENIAREQATAKSTLANLQQEKEALIQQQIEVRQQRSRDKRELLQIETDLERSAIKATANGTLFQLNLRNAGQRVIIGDTIAQIAPSNTPLVIKALIPTQEISQVKIGQSSQLRISACPYPDYGTLLGEVIKISPDVITPQSNPNQYLTNDLVASNLSQDAAFYEVTIQSKSITFGNGSKQCRLQLGMEGRADIIANEEAVLKFLLRKARLLTDT